MTEKIPCCTECNQVAVNDDDEGKCSNCGIPCIYKTRKELGWSKK